MRMQPESKMTERAMMAAWIAATLLCTVAAIKPANAAPSFEQLLREKAAAIQARQTCDNWNIRYNTKLEHLRNMRAHMPPRIVNKEIKEAKAWLAEITPQWKADCEKANQMINAYNKRWREYERNR